jgi:hypothetical protein
MSCVQSEVRDKTDNGFNEDILGPVRTRDAIGSKNGLWYSYALLSFKAIFYLE